MTPEELAAEIERLIVGNNSRFAAMVGNIQASLYNKIIGILKGLELDADGYIKQSSVNRKILREAQNVFDDLIANSPYQNSVESHLKVIPKLDNINVQYFKTISDVFSPNKNFIKELQRQVIRDVNVNLLNEGLIAQVKTPLNQILNQNVSMGGSFSGFQEQLRNFIKGNDQVEGRLLRYVRTYTKDMLFNYARGFQQAVVADLKLEWYSYSGGLMDKSRPFCIARAGNIYHQDEIESWAGLSWAGKNPNTTASSIFIYCAGYNCGHQLIPVHASLVPKERIAEL